MKLYYSPGACSLSPHIVLREAGLAFEPVLASTKTHKLLDGTDYYGINPKGYVPLLELDSGERLTEVPAIVQYIADQVPDKKLAPANGTFARARLQEWLNFTTSEIHKTYSPLFNPAVPEEYKTMARAKLVDRYRWVDAQLEGKSFLLGDSFSVADAYLVWALVLVRYSGIDLTPWPSLVAYLERGLARPSVRAALACERPMLKAGAGD